MARPTAVSGLLRRLVAPLAKRLDARAAHQARLVLDEYHGAAVKPLEAELDRVRTELAEARAAIELTPHPFEVLHLPAMPEQVRPQPSTGPFMETSTPTASDFVHPRFTELTAMCGVPPRHHRKVWERVFIVHHLLERDVLQAGSRGIGFGVGRETLPAAFASLGCLITATDAPADIAVEAGWAETGQFSGELGGLNNPDLLDPDDFRARVSFRTVDMTDIDADLTGYDFAWSSCAFEHLGSLRHGIEFVLDSTDCLRPGGVGVHTTEFNLSSDDATVEEPELSIYRRRDLEELCDELTARGHRVAPIVIGDDTSFLDHFVDLPPWRSDFQLKIRVQDFTVTSVGLVVERGGD